MRKVKDENRRKIKETRKNRVKEAKLHSGPKTLDRDTFIAQAKAKKEALNNREQLDSRTIKQLTFAEKLNLVKVIADEVINDTDKKYRKLNDLLLFTEEPKDIDVVLKAV